MESWNLKEEGAEPHEPRILSTAEDARAILLNLPQGEELQEHEVHERAAVGVEDDRLDLSEHGAPRLPARAPLHATGCTGRDRPVRRYGLKMRLPEAVLRVCRWAQRGVAAATSA